MKYFKIIDALVNPENLPDTGWFYLPADKTKWNLNTEGVFSLDSQEFSPDSDEYLPTEAKELGWIETLDKSLIEDIVLNLSYKMENPTPDKLFEAFLFYLENDAFL